VASWKHRVNRASIEICVQGVPSALAAQAGGADGIELCADLSVGGVTPSAGAIATAIERLSIPVGVLVRPRGGDFVHDATERAVIRRDVALAREQGAGGIVTGVLRPDGRVDIQAMRELIAEAGDVPVTFHKAFDEAPDPFEALDVLIELGVARVLTSGQARTAREGLAVLAGLERRASGRITILVGGQLRAADLPALHGAGLRAFHAGSAAGPPGATDAEAVRRFAAAVRQLDAGARHQGDGQ
jgi:copper homeostasis protein